jgi:hypothetical protein
MREAKLILPLLDNQGGDLYSVHQELAAVLTEAFGGFHSFLAEGHCAGYPPEGVRVYIIAALRDTEYSGWQDKDWTIFISPKLFAIARDFGRRAGQDSVYVRDFFGAVYITNCK